MLFEGKVKMFRFRALKSIFPYLLAAGDLVLVLAGFLAAFLIRFSGPVSASN